MSDPTPEALARARQEWPEHFGQSPYAILESHGNTSSATSICCRGHVVFARALDAYAAKRERAARDVIADLVNQFAVPGTVKGVPCRTTGALSDMEAAFEYLGLPDPCPESEWQGRLARAADKGEADG